MDNKKKTILKNLTKGWLMKQSKQLLLLHLFTE
jgi:hypothetical protein